MARRWSRRYQLEVTAADVDADGLPDVIVGQAVATGGVRVFRNRGRAAGAPATFADPEFGAWEVATADLDQDGDLDIAATNTDVNFQASRVAILRCSTWAM